MRRSTLFSALLLGSLFTHSCCVESKKDFCELPPLTSVQVTLENRVEEPEEIPETPVEPTGYIELTPQGGITYEGGVIKVQTHNIKYLAGPGTDQLPQNLSKEDFYNNTKNLPKRLEVKTLLDISRGEIMIANGLARFKRRKDLIRSPKDTQITRKDIIDDFGKLSEQIIESNSSGDYSHEDADRVKKMLSKKGLLIDNYPPKSRIVFEYNPRESFLKVTSYDPDGVKKREKSVHDTDDAFRRFFNERTRYCFRESDGSDAEIGKCAVDWGYENYCNRSPRKVLISSQE